MESVDDRTVTIHIITSAAGIRFTLADYDDEHEFWINQLANCLLECVEIELDKDYKDLNMAKTWPSIVRHFQRRGFYAIKTESNIIDSLPH